MRGPLAANVQGLPRAASTCWWLLGRNSWFQLELFQFDRPMAKLMPADFRPCDIGYTRIGIWVEDFDATMKTACRTWQSAADRATGRARWAARLCPQSRRGLCRDHGRRPAAALQQARACRLPGGDSFGDVVGAPIGRCRCIFRDRDRPQAQHRGPSHARARGVVGPGGCHHGKQAFRRRRGADRGGALPRSRRKAAAPTTTACRTRASSISRSGRAARWTSTPSIDAPKRLAPSPIAGLFICPELARWCTSMIRTAFPSRSCVRSRDWPTGSSDSSHAPYTSGRDPDTRRIEHRTEINAATDTAVR